MNNQIFTVEIRYMPDPEFLDKKGVIAKRLLSDNFKEWVIEQNRIELRNKDGFLFISYANLGFATTNKDKLPIFIESFDEALKQLGDLPPLRWGIRITSLVSSKKTFPALVDNYKNSLLNFQPKKFAKIDGNLDDLLVSYIFKNTKEHCTFHLSSGPMKKDQAKTYFQEKNLPNNGIFVDLDIYRTENQFFKDDFRRSRIIDFVKKSIDQGNTIVDDFARRLNEG